MVLGSIPAFLRRLSDFLWLHGVLIEIQDDGVERIRSLLESNLLADCLRPVTSCPTSPSSKKEAQHRAKSSSEPNTDTSFS